MHPLLLANQLIMLAGGIDGNKRPLDDSEKWGVTLVGLGVVIAALAILVVIILLFGKIFDQIDKNQKAKASAAAEKKKPKPAPAPAKKEPAPAPAAKSAPVPAATVSPVPAVSAEDDEEVIAVISAVVAMMSEQDGKAYRIKSVAKSQRNNGFSGRSAWAMDGRRQNVSPF